MSPIKVRRQAAPALIQEAARSVFKKPIQSPRIDVEIIFAAKERNLRADVDNVAKPILDALKDIVYAHSTHRDQSVHAIVITGTTAS